MKKLTKFLKILLITLLILFTLIIGSLFAIPYFFKDEILAKVKTELNNSVNAEVNFQDFSLSMFKHFPSLTVELKGLNVKGKNQFANDTLLSLDNFYIDLGLGGVLKGEAEVVAVILDRPVIKARVLEDGRANWEITLPSDKKEVLSVAKTNNKQKKKDIKIKKSAPIESINKTTDTHTKTSKASEEKIKNTLQKRPKENTVKVKNRKEKSKNFKIKLKKFAIQNAQIVYDDKSSKMHTSIDKINLTIKGDLSEEITELDIDFNIGDLDFNQAGVNMAKDMTFSFVAGIGVNLSDTSKMVFTFKENRLSISQLGLGFNGTVAMQGDNIDLDLTYETKETKFIDVLALVPSTFMKNLEELKTSGQFKIGGFAKGTLNIVKEQYPAFALNFMVKNGLIKYPDLSKSLNSIDINIDVNNKGRDLDYTLVNISKFNFKLGESPFKSKFKASTLISNPTFSGDLDGDINLSTMKDAVPMENLKLLGQLTTKMRFAANMKQIENEEFDKIEAYGNLKLNDFVFSYDSLPIPNDVTIPKANINFSPNKLSLSKLLVKIGNSDFDIKGDITKLLPFVFNKGNLLAKLNYKSKHIDGNDFIIPDPKVKDEDKSIILVKNVNVNGNFVIKPFPSIDTSKKQHTTPQPTEIPENIYAKVKTSVEKVQFDSLLITKIGGDVVVDKKQAKLKNFLLYMLDGSVLMNGGFSTKDKWNPSADFKLNIKEIDIQKTAKTFTSVKAMMPIAKSCHGKVSIDFNVKTKLDTAFSPVLNSVNGKGKLKSKQINLSKSKILDKVAKQLKNDKFRKIEAKNLNISFKIVNGDIIVSPFEVKQWNSNMIVGGTQSLDQTIDFDIKYDIAREDLGAEANKSLSKISALTGGFSDALIGKRIKVDTKVVGTSKDPKVKLVFGKSDSSKGDNKKTEDKVIKEVQDLLKDKKKLKELEKAGKKLLKDLKLW